MRRGGGGTWMGFNSAGIVVGLTNLGWRDFMTPRPRERGEEVSTLLSVQSLNEAQQRLAELPVQEMGPFNIVCATIEGDGFVACSADTLEISTMKQGIHVISNLKPYTPWDKTDRLDHELRQTMAAVTDTATEAAETIWPLATRLEMSLSRHVDGGSPQHSICVHTDRDYGTVSSAVMLASPRWSDNIYRYADGPPCQTPFVDLSAELRQIERV